MKKFVLVLIFIVMVLLIPILLFATDALASNGFVTYRSNTSGAAVPNLRLWNSSSNGSFSSEISLQNAGSNIRQSFIKLSPVSSKVVMVTFSDDGNLDAYVCMYNCTNANSWVYTSNFANIGVSTQRRFDFGFESATGDLVLVYGIISTNTTQDLAYKILPATETSFADLTTYYIDDTTQIADINYSWIALDSNPRNYSSELTLIGFDLTGSDVLSWVWNGTDFTNQLELSTTSTVTGNYGAIATRYVSDGSRSIVAAGTGTVGNLATAYWNGTVWSGITSTDIDASDGNDIRWISLKSNPVNLDMQAVIVDSGNDLTTEYWNNTASSWTITTNIDIDIDISTTRPVDFSWVNDTYGKLVWDTDTNETTLNETTCSPNCNGARSMISTYANNGRWIGMYKNPNSSDEVDFIGLRLNSVFQLGAFYYNGTNYTNYGNTILTINSISSTYESFMMGFVVDTVVPAADFISPTPNNSEIVNDSDIVTIKLSAFEPLLTAIIEFNGTNYTMDASVVSYNQIWSSTFSSLANGTYFYKVYLTDWYGNNNFTITQNFTINYTYVFIENNFTSSPVEAIVAYRRATSASIPNIRFWNSTDYGTFSSEIQLANSGSNLRQNVIKLSSVSSKAVMVTFSDDGNLDAYVCMYNCSYASSWFYSSNIASTGASTERRFDFEFESATDNLVLVYSTTSVSGAQDLAYMVLAANATNFSGLTNYYIDDTTQPANVVYTWVAMGANPNNSSSELTLIGFESTNFDVLSWIWNGTNFTNQLELCTAATATTAYEAISTSYISDGSRSIIASGDGTVGNLTTAYWNGTVWSGITSTDIDASDSNDIRWVNLKPNPVTLDMQAVIVDSGNDLTTEFWNNTASSWTITTNIDADIDIAITRPVDFSWIRNGSYGKLVWDTDTVSGSLSQCTCAPLCSGTVSTISTYLGNGSWIALYQSPRMSSAVDFIGLRLNSLFNLGSFYYNGNYFSNYGDEVLTNTSGVSTYESFTWGFVKDVRLPYSSFIAPTPENFQKISYADVVINLSSNEPLRYAILELESTSMVLGNYSMSPDTSLNNFQKGWSILLNSLEQGNYSYRVYLIDWYDNINITEYRNFTLNFPPNVTIVTPTNNTLNLTSRNITFYYIVNDTLDPVSSCSLIVDNFLVANTTSSPVNPFVVNNFTYMLTNGQHNWSIICNDTNDFNSTNYTRNLTIQITPKIESMILFDEFSPQGQVILSAGSSKFVNCSITVSDFDGINNIINATATLYYYLNKSGDLDDNSVHYTNSSCVLSSNTSINKTFSCGFNVLYYANNGTWNCNATSMNSYSNWVSYNDSISINPLYSLNLTDGMMFGEVQANTSSSNITINITNFGNMPINITLQGYAVIIGDNVGMNCSDNTNVTISSIRFSTNNTANFNQKIPLDGSIQPLNFRINKQTNSTVIFNTTYWQISPDPGSVNRICGGYVIFNAQAS